MKDQNTVNCLRWFRKEDSHTFLKKRNVKGSWKCTFNILTLYASWYMNIRNEWVVENFQNIFTIFLDPLSDQTSNWLSDLTTLSQNWPLQRALFFCDVPVFKFWKNAFNKAVNLFRAVHCSFRFNYLICSASTIYVAVNCEQLPFQLCSRFLFGRLTINWVDGDRNHKVTLRY